MIPGVAGSNPVVHPKELHNFSNLEPPQCTQGMLTRTVGAVAIVLELGHPTFSSTCPETRPHPGSTPSVVMIVPRSPKSGASVSLAILASPSPWVLACSTIPRITV